MRPSSASKEAAQPTAYSSQWMATKGRRNGMQRAWLETSGAKQVVESKANSDLDKPYRVITE